MLTLSQWLNTEHDLDKDSDPNQDQKDHGLDIDPMLFTLTMTLNVCRPTYRSFAGQDPNPWEVRRPDHTGLQSMTSSWFMMIKMLIIMIFQ